MKKLSFIFTIILAFALEALSQSGYQSGNPRDKGLLFDFGLTFTAEIIETPTNDIDSVIANICYRIPYKILPFKKVPDKELFFTIYNIEVEFKDKIGVIRKRVYDNDTIIINDYEDSKSNKLNKIGLFETTVAMDEYQISVKLTDANSKLVKEISLNQFFNKIGSERELLGAPIFVYKENLDNDTYFPFIYGNNIDFACSNASILFQIAFDSDIFELDYKIEPFFDRKQEFFWDTSAFLSGKVFPQKNKTFKITFKNNKISQKIIAINSNLNKNDSIELGVIEIKIPENQIIPGNYLLTLWSPSSKDSIKVNFKIDWFDMPVSLRSPDFAIEAMYYILNDDEFKEYRSGSRKDVFLKILKYWKNQDPTPETHYNESMAEYFRRVDYASLNFGTFTQKNGVKTDKGKIYILYGYPSSIKQFYENDVNTEIWKYDNLKKEFIFIAESSNDFLLKKVIEK